MLTVKHIEILLLTEITLDDWSLISELSRRRIVDFGVKGVFAVVEGVFAVVEGVFSVIVRVFVIV